MKEEKTFGMDRGGGHSKLLGERATLPTPKPCCCWALGNDTRLRLLFLFAFGVIPVSLCVRSSIYPPIDLGRPIAPMGGEAVAVARRRTVLGGNQQHRLYIYIVVQ